MVWDGDERREKEKEERQKVHDALIRIDVNLNNFLEKFSTHLDEDKTNFKDMLDKISSIQKLVWMMLGAMVIINFIAKFINLK